MVDEDFFPHQRLWNVIYHAYVEGWLMVVIDTLDGVIDDNNDMKHS
jgi:hypothetical protein